MLSLFRWSFNAVGNRIQSSMAGPRATPSKGNYPYLQVTARRMQSCTKVVPNFLSCYPCGACRGFDQSPTRRSTPPTPAGNRSRNHPATGIKRRPKKSRREFEFTSLRQRVLSFRDSLPLRLKNAHLAGIRHQKSTGEPVSSGFKREFRRFLFVRTFGGGLSL
jgi:hypothetical protein